MRKVSLVLVVAAAIVAGASPAFAMQPTRVFSPASSFVVPSAVETVFEAHPGYAGFDVEVDGHQQPIEGTSFTIRLVEPTQENGRDADALIVDGRHPSPTLPAAQVHASLDHK